MGGRLKTAALAVRVGAFVVVLLVAVVAQSVVVGAVVVVTRVLHVLARRGPGAS